MSKQYRAEKYEDDKTVKIEVVFEVELPKLKPLRPDYSSVIVKLRVMNNFEEVLCF